MFEQFVSGIMLGTHILGAMIFPIFLLLAMRFILNMMNNKKAKLISDALKKVQSAVPQRPQGVGITTYPNKK